jgi:hypothetical protein
MAETVVDLTNYKDRVGSRVDPGRYVVTVTDAELDESKQGNQMINLWLQIQGGEFAGQGLVDRLVLTEKSLFRVVGFLQALGFPTPNKRIKINTAKFVGRSLAVEVDDGEPYNGRTKSEVRGYARLTAADSNGASAAAADLDLDGLDEFAAPPPTEVNPEAAALKAHVEDGDPVITPPEAIDLDEIDLG